MNEFKGTKGPWVAVPSSRGGDWIEQAVAYEGDVAVPDPIECPGSGGAMSYTRTICAMHWSGTEEWRANAALVASAPALLAALEGCQKVLAILLNPRDDGGPLAIATAWAQCVEAETKARAALALASPQKIGGRR